MSPRNALVLYLVAAACGSALAGPNTPTTSASDVVTIDQSKALAGGISAGDTAGFPITISTSGSYRLTSNLVVPAGVNAIQIATNNVTIDLNGFTIQGPGYCNGQGASITCTETSTFGVTQMNGTRDRMAVQNGTVGGFGYCMSVGFAARLTDLTLNDCSTAMSVSNGSIVSRVVIQRATNAGAIYQSNVEQVHVHAAAHGFMTTASALRGISMNNVHQAFGLNGAGNSALAMSSINATLLGNGFVSVGGNLCNGVAC